MRLWGYKFYVIPEGFSPLSIEFSMPAIWVLDKISSITKMPAEFMEITSLKCLQLIFLHSLSTFSLELKLESFKILRKIIKGQRGSYITNILKTWVAQANELNKIVAPKKMDNRLMQASAQLLEDASHSNKIIGEEPWLIEFSDLVSDIKGLSEKDELLEAFLFESFKKNVTCTLRRTYESRRPYIRKTIKECINIPGASSISIVFDSNLCLDPRDTVIFSYDEYGKELVEEKKFDSNINSCLWVEDFCGRKITFENENSRVTRTKESGWGNAIWSENYSDGTVSIKFNIESDGNSEHFYIGVYKTSKNIQDYDLNEYIGCDCSNEVWSWKRNGEVHKKGWSKDWFSGFKSGDEITMLIDMNLRELTFFNGVFEVFKFTGIASSVTPVVCFGGIHQVIAVISVERTAGLSSLVGRKLNVVGDRVYYWIPTYKAANIKHFWDSNQNGAIINEDKTMVIKINSEKTYHEAEVEMRYGKYYIEAFVESKGDLGVGFMKKSSINAGVIEESQEIVIYYNNGKIGNKESEGYDQNDVIGCYIDFDKNEIAFYKNDKLIETVQVFLSLEDSEDCFRFIAVLSEQNQSLSLWNKWKYPANIDLMKIDSEQETEFWGYQFSITPTFKGRNIKLIEPYLSFASDEIRQNWTNIYKPKYSKFFKDGIAQQFIEFLDEYIEVNEIRGEKLWNGVFDISHDDLIYYPDLQNLSNLELTNLKEILLNFNSRFRNNLYLFDLQLDKSENSLMKYLKKSKYYLQLWSNPGGCLYDILYKSSVEHGIKIIIDKNKAQKIKDKRETDNSATASMFSQISRALGGVSNKLLRSNYAFFDFTFKGDDTPNGTREYQALLMELSKELQSSILPLLIPSQNNVLNIGNGRDNWIINPISTLPVHMHLFTTLGKFFGSALRTKEKLNLSLPIVFFKHILYENVSTDDLRDFDFPLYQFLHKLRNLEAYGIT